jgi:hypothetical protein
MVRYLADLTTLDDVADIVTIGGTRTFSHSYIFRFGRISSAFITVFNWTGFKGLPGFSGLRPPYYSHESEIYAEMFFWQMAVRHFAIVSQAKYVDDFSDS